MREYFVIVLLYVSGGSLFINPDMSTRVRTHSSSWVTCTTKLKLVRVGIFIEIHAQGARTKPCPSDQYPFGRWLFCQWCSSPPQPPLYRHKHRRNPAASHPLRDLGPRHLSTSPRLCAPLLFSTRRMAHRHRHPRPLDHDSYLVSVPA